MQSYFLRLEGNAPFHLPRRPTGIPGSGFVQRCPQDGGVSMLVRPTDLVYALRPNVP